MCGDDMVVCSSPLHTSPCDLHITLTVGIIGVTLCPCEATHGPSEEPSCIFKAYYGKLKLIDSCQGSPMIYLECNPPGLRLRFEDKACLKII